MFRTILADLRAHVHPQLPPVLYWTTLVGKSLVTPAIHVVVLYRLSTVLYRFPPTRPLSFVLRSIAIVWGGTEIHPGAEIGPGLRLMHSQKVVIAGGVRIGSNVRISHGVSIGSDTGRSAAKSAGNPVIGDDVTIALDSIVLGAVTIGDRARISAQSLVVRDVPAGGVVAGSPARLVGRDEPQVEVSGTE